MNKTKTNSRGGSSKIEFGSSASNRRESREGVGIPVGCSSPAKGMVKTWWRVTRGGARSPGLATGGPAWSGVRRTGALVCWPRPAPGGVASGALAPVEDASWERESHASPLVWETPSLAWMWKKKRDARIEPWPSGAGWDEWWCLIQITWTFGFESFFLERRGYSKSGAFVHFKGVLFTRCSFPLYLE
jgi:hypothetical protein